MTGDLTVPGNEAGVTRVFALNLSAEEARKFVDGDAASLEAALGAERVDPAHVQTVRTADLEPLGLSGLLTEGFAAPEQAVARDKAKLDALDGHVLIVGSRAFGGAEVRLRPSAQITLIGTYRDPATVPSFEPIRSDATAGTVPPPEGPQSATPGPRMGSGLLVVAALVVAAVIVLLVT